jgi:protease YdgD
MNTHLTYFHLTYFPLILALLSACAPPPDNPPKNVFGPDNRERILNRAYPWSTIGRLETGCTGVLVGRRLALTAAHCVWDASAAKVPKTLTYFSPAMIDGRVEDRAWIERVWFGTDKPDTERGKDWAILLLSEDLSRKYRWMAVAKVDFAALLPYTVNTAGYSIDLNQGGTASVHRGCFIHRVVGERLLHDCDAMAGISGAPMFTVIDGTPTVVALSVSEYRQGASDSVVRSEWSADYSNVGISAAAFADTLSQIQRAMETGTALAPFSDVREAANTNIPDASVDPNLPSTGMVQSGETSPPPPPDPTPTPPPPTPPSNPLPPPSSGPSPLLPPPIGNPPGTPMQPQCQPSIVDPWIVCPPPIP